jgi:hypothetical protein
VVEVVEESEKRGKGDQHQHSAAFLALVHEDRLPKSLSR